MEGRGSMNKSRLAVRLITLSIVVGSIFIQSGSLFICSLVFAAFMEKMFRKETG
jgi:hypothetical protein